MDNIFDKFIGQVCDENVEAEIRSNLNGFSVRFWYPTSIGTADYQTNRYNVYINSDNVITKIDIG